MERKCENCEEWEGHVHWKAKTRFWFPLRDNFTEKSYIPGNFVKKLKENLGKVVHLKGPSGKTWDVNLKNASGITFFGDGWKAFVEENLLEEHDLLLFKYKGESLFKVSIFDDCGCEKTSAYLIKECNHQSVSQGNINDASASDQDFTAVIPTLRPICPVIELTGEDDPTEPAAGESNNSGEPEKKKKRATKKHQDERISHKKLKIEAATSSVQPDTGESHEGNATISEMDAAKSSYATYLLSKRRKVTDEEIEAASKRAKEFQSDNPFFWKPMKATHVYRGFFMAVPRKFAADYLPSQKAIVTLRSTPHSKQNWVVSFRMEKCSYGFGGDWRKFVQDNHLEEGDACVFELKEGNKAAGNNIVMHVHIFRVVELDQSSEPPPPRRFRR